MRTYTLQEVCHSLGLNNRQLQRLLNQACIEPQSSAIDGRRREISQEQLDQLRSLQPVVHVGKSLASSPLESRLTMLERELRALRAEVAQLRGGVNSRPAETLPDRSLGVIGADGLIGKRESARMAVAHGANSFASALDWEWSDDDRVDRAVVLARVRDYLGNHPRAGRWQECEDESCPCHL